MSRTRSERNPGWTPAWDRKATKAEAFQAMNGRLPSEDAADSEEAASGLWLRRERLAIQLTLAGVRKRSPAQVTRVLAIPGFSLDPGAEAFRAEVDEWAAFVAEHGGRHPSRNPNAPRNERRLGRFERDVRAANANVVKGRADRYASGRKRPKLEPWQQEYARRAGLL